MSDRYRDRDARGRHDAPRGRSLSRSTSLRRYDENATSRNYNRDDRYRPASRSRSPPRKHRHSTDSRSRSRSPRRDRIKEKEGVRSRERKHPSRTRSYSRSRSRSRTRHRRHRSRSPSSSSSSSSDSDRHHKKRRKDKHRKRSRSRDRDKKRKEKKKAKKEKKKKQKGSSGAQWGKYGIINESNMYEKEAEFRTWLVEERMINPEVLSKEQTKKEFARFAEDYNTATLPHEKYYDITAYERRLSLIRSGETLPPVNDSYDPDADLRAHSSAIKSSKRITEENETYMSKEQLEELLRVQRERNQVGKMKLMGMNIGQSFGVRMDGNEFEG